MSNLRQRDNLVTGSPGPSQIAGWYTDSWAVVVGIDKYQSEAIRPLACATSNALRVAEAIVQLGFPPDHVFKRLNEEASKQEIERLLKSVLYHNTRPDDRLLFFFAGHGKTEEPTGAGSEGFLLPWDADPNDLPYTALSMMMR
jgi:uncharacterized caspase-like protein